MTTNGKYAILKKKISSAFREPSSPLRLVLVVPPFVALLLCLGTLSIKHNIILPPITLAAGGIEWTDDMGRGGAFDVQKDSLSLTPAKPIRSGNTVR